MSCPYKHVLGIPEKGFHATRLFGLALYDILGTIMLGFILTLISGMKLWKSVLLMFVLGEILHYWFGVQTAFLTLLNITAC